VFVCRWWAKFWNVLRVVNSKTFACAEKGEDTRDCRSSVDGREEK